MDASEDHRARRTLRIAAVAIGALAYWRLLVWVPARDLGPLNAWLFLTTDPFPQAIFLIAAALVYRRRESLRIAMRSEGSPALAILPLLAGCSLFVWGHYVGAMDLVLASFLFVSLGIALLWFGARFARALAIPWVVLAFAFPAPAVLTNQAYYGLRLATASHATRLLQLAGFPVLREGNVIIGSDVVAQVVDTCSGLRSMEMLALAAIVFVGWYPARRIRQVLFVVLAPAIAYLFNLFRVGVMVLAPSSEFSTNHSMQGLAVFFGAVSFLIVSDRVFGHLLRAKPQVERADPRRETGDGLQSDGGSDADPDGEATPGSAPPPEAKPESGACAEPEIETASRGFATPRGRGGSALLVALAVTLLGVSIWMPRWISPESNRFEPPKLPAQIDGWTQTQKLDADRGFLWTVRFRRYEYWDYERDGDVVSVFIGYDDHSERRRSLLSRKNALPERGWEVVQRSFLSLEPIEAPVVRVVARSGSEQVLTYHWYEGTDAMATEVARALLALDQSSFRRPQPARVIRVETALGSTPLEREEDEATLREFISSLIAALRE